MVQIGTDSGLMPRPVRRTGSSSARPSGLRSSSTSRPPRASRSSCAAARHGGGNPSGARYVGALMQFRVGRPGARPDAGAAPAAAAARLDGERLAPEARPHLDDHDRRRLHPAWKINGKTFNPARSDAFPELGTTETWEIVNRTAVTHMMHMHHTDWYLLSRNGRPPPPWEDCLKETFFLPRRTDPGSRPFLPTTPASRDPLPHARPRGPWPDEPVRGRAPRLKGGGAVEAAPRLASVRYRAARRDPALAVLEGFHALKHALRFGAEVRRGRRRRPGCARGVGGGAGARPGRALPRPGQPVDADLAELVPQAPRTGVVAIARRPRVDLAALLADPGRRRWSCSRTRGRWGTWAPASGLPPPPTPPGC